jgi:uncharacterized lipoprotein YajG
MTRQISRARILASVLVFSAALSACAWTPHELDLAPKTLPVQSAVGNGTSLYFKFTDERDDLTIGHRSTATVGAKISAANLPATVEKSLREELQSKKFVIMESEEKADASVVYRLRAFKFYISQGFWAGKKNVSAVLAVDAHRGGKSYSNIYRYNSADTIVFVPGGKDIDAQMNDALEQILDKAAADKDLEAFLVGH